jgi:hypothetical protein
MPALIHRGWDTDLHNRPDRKVGSGDSLVDICPFKKNTQKSRHLSIEAVHLALRNMQF